MSYVALNCPPLCPQNSIMMKGGSRWISMVRLLPRSSSTEWMSQNSPAPSNIRSDIDPPRRCKSRFARVAIQGRERCWMPEHLASNVSNEESRTRSIVSSEQHILHLLYIRVLESVQGRFQETL
eukprot:764002-Hanusia_phi.AAC.3